MTGKQLIDAIQKHHLENFDISRINTWMDPGISIIFDNGDIELPYPKDKDSLFDAPAHIYMYKVLVVDDAGDSECYDKEIDTSK